MGTCSRQEKRRRRKVVESFHYFENVRQKTNSQSILKRKFLLTRCREVTARLKAYLTKTGFKKVEIK